MNISDVKSIKELKRMKADARAAYHGYARQCDERIAEMRAGRPPRQWSAYYEEGRSRARSNPHALEGDMQ
tara:strand:+ start:156 stop:365 length:210 start_codon:yes stop_codon:yes gene_type:complete